MKYELLKKKLIITVTSIELIIFYETNLKRFYNQFEVPKNNQSVGKKNITVGWLYVNIRSWKWQRPYFLDIVAIGSRGGVYLWKRYEFSRSMIFPNLSSFC